VFDDAWKEIPPYPRFSIPKKAYREITQWQGKEIRNLGRCISAVLASALRNPDSSQYQDFKSALKCVSALVDFTLIPQYRSHTPDTPSYMESYLQRFHRTKDIFLEFRTSKATRAQANLVFVMGPGPIPHPAPLNGTGRGVLFYGSLPLPPAPPVP